MSKNSVNKQRKKAVHSPLYTSGEVTYSDIFKKYRNSRFGQYHSGQDLRFSRFPYDAKQKLRDLGPDVHPVMHMQHTHRNLLIPILHKQVSLKRAGEISPSDIVALRLAALLHDTGECKMPELEKSCGRTVGDVEARIKTADDDKAESAIRKFISAELFAGIISDSDLERTEQIVSKVNPDDPATHLFGSAEILGYHSAGMEAGKVALIHTREFEAGINLVDKRLESLGRMAIDVPDYWRFDLEDAAGSYPYIADYLEANRELSRDITKTLIHHVV